MRLGRSKKKAHKMHRNDLCKVLPTLDNREDETVFLELSTFKSTLDVGIAKMTRVSIFY